MREAANRYAFSAITVSGTFNKTIDVPPGTSGYIEVTSLAFSTDFDRITLKVLRATRGGGGNATLCTNVPIGTISAPNGGVIPGEFCLLSPGTISTRHEGEFTPFRVCCCPCQPQLLFPSHDPNDPADVPPLLGQVTYTWTGPDPSPGPKPSVDVYGWAYPAINPARCRETFYNPDFADYTYSAGPQSIAVRKVVSAYFDPNNFVLNRTDEWVATIHGETTYGRFQLSWVSPQGFAVYLNFLLQTPVVTFPVSSPNARWGLESFSSDDPAFNIADFQITAETNGVRVALVGRYLFQFGLGSFTVNSNTTQALSQDATLPPQSTGAYLSTFVLDAGTGIYSPNFIVSISVDQGTDCLEDLGATDTVSLDDPLTYTTGSYTITAAWS